MSPSTLDIDDLYERNRAWHARRGNDLRIGRHLLDLTRAAGLIEEEFRGWFEIGEFPAGVRGPAWAAHAALVRDGLAGADDVARWDAAFVETDSWTTRPRFVMGMFAVLAHRPDSAQDGQGAPQP